MKNLVRFSDIDNKKPVLLIKKFVTPDSNIYIYMHRMSFWSLGPEPCLRILYWNYGYYHLFSNELLNLLNETSFSEILK